MMTRDRCLRVSRGVLFALTALSVVAVEAQSAGDGNATPVKQEPSALLARAATTLSNFLQDPAMDWFRQNVDSAHGMLVVPEYVKIGLLAAGASGAAVLIARDGDGAWVGPVFYELNTASLGLQAGVERSEMILMVRTQRGLDGLLASNVKFGGKISAAAGPVGASAVTETEDIVYFVRKSSGGFLGMSLDGTVVEPDQELNAEYYGREASPLDVLVRGSIVSSTPNPMLDALK